MDTYFYTNLGKTFFVIWIVLILHDATYAQIGVITVFNLALFLTLFTTKLFKKLGEYTIYGLTELFLMIC